MKNLVSPEKNVFLHPSKLGSGSLLMGHCNEAGNRKLVKIKVCDSLPKKPLLHNYGGQ